LAKPAHPTKFGSDNDKYKICLFHTISYFICVNN
jgi:hypothetical protein